MTDIYTLGIKADSRDIDRGKTSLDKFSDSAGKAAKKTNQIRDNVNMAGKAVATFGVAAASALGVVAVRAGNAALQIEKLSMLSGLNTEEFQKAAFAAQKYGIEQDKLADIFKDTQDKIGDFLATGGGELINFFENVAPLANVTRESFKGLTGQQGLQLYVDSLEKANVSQEEMVFFMEAIGNDSTALLPLLRNNGEEFARIGDRAEQLGIVLDKIDLDNLTEMNSALKDLGAVSNAAGNVIGATLAPFITELTESFIDGVGSADDYRESILNMAQAGVTVAGVFANAGRVFEILGRSIGAFAFQTGEELSTIEERFELLYASYQVFARNFDVVTATWINSLLEMGASGADDFVNYFIDGLNGLVAAVTGNGLLGKVIDSIGISIGKISNIEIEAPTINVSELAQSLDLWESRQSDLEDSLVGSNEKIAAAWADVRALIAEPVPSEGMDDWFNKLREGIELTRKLAEETKDSGKEQETTIKGLAKTWDKSLTETGKGVNALSTILNGNEKAQKALHKVSQAIAVAEAFQTIQKIALGTTEAGVHVANETTKQSANALTAITSAFAAPFPVNFVAGAAMIGIMASLVGGISGGGGASFDPTEDRQESQGTGSVFGSDDKSASISKAQERFEDIQIDQLSELRGIRGSLNNIGSGIAQVTKGLITGNVGEFSGSLEGSRSGSSSLGKLLTGEVFGLDIGGLGEKFVTALFGSTKKKVIDSGIEFISQTLGEVIENGTAQAQSFFEIETKKKKLFGLSSSTSVSTENQELGQNVNDQIGAIFESIGSTVTSAVAMLGLSTRESAEDMINNFSLDIGKISFEGLSGEEIQAELEAVFSQQADLIAKRLAPSIEEFQQVGEGLFDTLLRVTQEQVVFNDALANMGMSLADLGNVLQIEIAQGIIELVGGAERFSDLTQSFFSDFFSDAEQFDILAGSITDVFSGLGIALSDSRGAFRELVESQDLTTESGRQLFATLLEIAPAMDEYFDVLEEGADDLKDSASDAFDVLSQSIGLERDRISEVLNGQKEIFRDEMARISGVRAALQSTFAELTANVEAAKTAVNLAFVAEKTAIQEASALRIEGIESERLAAQTLHDTNIDQINAQKSAVQDSISTLTSISGSLRGALPQGDPQVSLEQALSDARRGSFGAAGALDVGSLSRDPSQFETAEQFNVAQGITTGQTNELANLVDSQLSIEEQTLASLERQEATAQASFVKQSESFDQRVKDEQKAAELALAMMDSQLAAILGLDTGILSIDQSITALHAAQAEVSALDFENQMLALAQDEDAAAEALDQAESSSREQNENLDRIFRASRDQLNKLFQIDDSVLSVTEAIAQLEATIKAADARTQAANLSIAKSSASTANNMQRQLFITEANI